MAQKKNTNKKQIGTETIAVKGARVHNLKNVDVEMPRNNMIVFTGVSGSGKSSLAFDTIFAEGQRRYVESLSSYARQFLQQMAKPDVDEIQGLSPAISIDQKSRSNNPRSTVATITEIYDYLRVLFARIGRPYSPISGLEITKLSNQEIADFIQKTVAKQSNEKTVFGVKWNEAQVHVFAPLVRGRKGEYYQLLYDLLNKGYAKVRIDGKMHNLRDSITLAKNKPHEIDVLVDTFAVHEFSDDPEDAEMRLFEAIERSLTEADGLVRVLFGDHKRHADGDNEYLLSAKLLCPEDGYIFPEIEPRLFSFNSPYGACQECNGLGTKYFHSDEVCPSCEGARLREEALNVFLGGKEKGVTIVDFVNMTIEDASEFIHNLPLSEKEEEVARMVISEITDRLHFMLNVGLHYLTLNRRAHTLSGGESQRIRLAGQLGSRLVGAMYVLDEPTIGLHQRDNDRLINTLLELRNLGNTIIVVEHDEDTIMASDYLVDIGPGAGVHGGEVVVSGELDTLLDPDNTKLPPSRTLAYLRGEEKIPLPEKRRTNDKGQLRIVGANKYNISNQNIDVPLGRFVAITGVSGAGKSTFLDEILYTNLRARFDKRHRTDEVYNVARFEGRELLSRSVLIDQSPIGRTPRSNVATYTGAWTHIRELFAATTEAQVRGWKPGRFSFNVKGGRCEACQGKGIIEVEMHFLPTVYVTCDVCHGRRFDTETLKVEYKQKNIYDVLQMTVEEAYDFFADIPPIYDRLKTLCEVGLGYIALGQPATTLSGGEAQRVKIASELYRPHTRKALYLLDEPTVGLHYDDVRNLISVLDKLVQQGNTVVVIEHNLELIKSADHVIDFGPEGGDGGGIVIATGTPEEVAGTAASHTGQYLKRVLRKK